MQTRVEYKPVLPRVMRGGIDLSNPYEDDALRSFQQTSRTLPFL